MRRQATNGTRTRYAFSVTHIYVIGAIVYQNALVNVIMLSFSNLLLIDFHRCSFDLLLACFYRQLLTKVERFWLKS